jgi:uncharacterized membrane protein
MNILQAFLPFLAFALFDRIAGSVAGLTFGAAVAVAMLLRETVIRKHSAKVLEVGTAFLFGGLAIYSLIAKPEWSVIGVRLPVDLGLLLIVLASLALGRPFTEQYAREQVDPDEWDSPLFQRVNRVLSTAWALVFLTLVIVEYLLLTMPQLQHRLGIWSIIGALAAGIWFSDWYPKRARHSVRQDE